MKYQKSSCSLHNKASQPFYEQNMNTISYNRTSSIFKRFNPNQKDTSLVYNARGKLNSCLNHLQELQNQIEAMNSQNKVPFFVDLGAEFVTDLFTRGVPCPQND